jgi:hypothetical protein
MDSERALSSVLKEASIIGNESDASRVSRKGTLDAALTQIVVKNRILRLVHTVMRRRMSYPKPLPVQSKS